VITWLWVPATAISGGITHQFQAGTYTEDAEQIWMSVGGDGKNKLVSKVVKTTPERETEISAEFDP